MKLGGFKLSEMSQDTEDLRLTDLSVVCSTQRHSKRLNLNLRILL